MKNRNFIKIIEKNIKWFENIKKTIILAMQIKLYKGYNLKNKIKQLFYNCDKDHQV